MPKYVPVYVRKLIIDRFLRNDAPELIANDYNVAKSYIYGLVNRYIANGSLLTQMERNKKMNNIAKFVYYEMCILGNVLCKQMKFNIYTFHNIQIYTISSMLTIFFICLLLILLFTCFMLFS